MLRLILRVRCEFLYLVQPSVFASGLEMGTWATNSLYDSSTSPLCLNLSVPIYNMKWGTGWSLKNVSTF